MVFWLIIGLTVAAAITLGIIWREEGGVVVGIVSVFGLVALMVYMIVVVPIFSKDYKTVDVQVSELTSFSEYAGGEADGALLSVDSTEDTVSYVQDGKIVQVDLDSSEVFSSDKAEVKVSYSEARNEWVAPWSWGSYTTYEFYVPSDTIDYTSKG